jgi:starvation-inducible DNA-binding protein
MSGCHFRDYHLLLDEQVDQLRARKIGGNYRDISRHRQLADNNEDVVSLEDMLGKLLADNRRLTGFLRVTHEICGRPRA